MALYPVYSLWNIEPQKALGCHLWDSQGREYLDLYGGHAVISIGHCHPHYIQRIENQLHKIGFYSNAVQNGLQVELSQKLGRLSGYPSYSLFLCNTGAEANENALKLASFQTGRARVLAIGKAFHGRSGGAVAATDNPGMRSAFNSHNHVDFVPLGDQEALTQAFATASYAAVIIEGIQGVAGIFEAPTAYWQCLRRLCTAHGTFLIADEVQSGYGRTGRFFAHQWHGIEADLITMAKGMGNGFPIGGVLISPAFTPQIGQLGTTFGGNHLACAAALAVLEVMEREDLVAQAARTGAYLWEGLQALQERHKGIQALRGRGLMIGIALDPALTEVRNQLLFTEHIFTGGAGKTVIRLLPPLSLSLQEAQSFLEALDRTLAQ